MAMTCASRVMAISKPMSAPVLSAFPLAKTSTSLTRTVRGTSIEPMSTWRFSVLRGAARLVVVALVLGVPGRVRSQNGVGDIVYTVGTVARDAHGRDWAYLLWQATQPAL